MRSIVAACLVGFLAPPLLAQPAERVAVSGTLVDKNGAPLAAKTVCMLFQTDDGKWFFPLDISSGGQLSANTAKTDAQGQFSLRVERHKELKVGVCEGHGFVAKPVKSSTKVYAMPKGEKAIALGKVTLE